jgi:hypothetical protein
VSLHGVSEGRGAVDEDTSGGVPLVRLVRTAPGRVRQFGRHPGQRGGRVPVRRTFENVAEEWSKVTEPDDPFIFGLNGLSSPAATHGMATAA